MDDEEKKIEGQSMESSHTTSENIETTTQINVAEDLNLDKEKIIKQLKAAKNVEQRVKLFAKLTDTFGLEAIAGIIPGIGDVTPALISTCYLIAEGIRIGLPRQKCLQILGYQTADVIAGSIPVIGNIVDFFFKGNKYSAKVFSDHLEKLKKAAKEMGISQEEIDNIGKEEAKYIKTMDRYLHYSSQKKKK